MSTIRILLISLICLLCQYCMKESINSFMFHLKNNIYLDHSTRSIRFMHKNGENSLILGNVIVNNIDSAYINKDKTLIYVINNKGECIWVKSDFKTEKINKRPKVEFRSITSYHD